MKDLSTLSIEERNKIADENLAIAEQELEKAIEEGKVIKQLLKIQAKYNNKIQVTKEEKKVLFTHDPKAFDFYENYFSKM